MKKRLQRITGHAAGTPKTTTLATCLCFRVTTTAKTTATTTTTRRSSGATTLNAARVKVLSIIIFSTFAGCSAIGYSYSRFEGPVVGPEQLVQVPDAYGGGTHSDYVARPEYSFAYGVEDGQTRLLQNRKETRNGDAVKGVYSVVDPDGTLRVVKYTADDANGFQAEVITNGIGRLHGHGNGAAAVDEQVEHEQSNEVQPQAADDEEYDGEEEEGEQHEEETPQQGKGQYKVHEDHDEGEGEGDEGDEGDGEEGGGDHEEYEGSSEEGYEDAKPQREEEESDSSEEY
ncbi:uncharacterized protein LOC132792294 isoform X1 [Drosophila nasuta]|uniref:uncharacterized protein LOC132792294 isoform X1 n=1 Tax=Drosophila nasuta TaxID=42062 RepID=UPI00295F16AE|nr:uncharacterized protein LOC132792294 isoform X1 [Drosophila nasuta]